MDAIEPDGRISVIEEFREAVFSKQNLAAISNSRPKI
jgi:hypothetical protein